MGWLGDAFGWVWDHTLGPVANSAAGFVWDQVMQGIVSWIVDAVAWFVGQVLSLLEDSTKVDLRAGWFVDPGGPYRTVLGIAAVLLVGFVFLGLLQGLLAGDPLGMVTRIARDLPLAVLGMVVTIAVTSKLLELADALSHTVLRGGGDNAKEVLRVISNASSFSGQTSFVIAVLGLLCIIAALFVWVELVIRAALIYLLIALSPLVLAAMVWPTARGMVRKLAELLVALIFSKVVIAIAFSVGAAALAGIGDAGHANTGAGEQVAASAGTLFSGLVIFCLAAFAPFVLLKLFPAAEAAVVAQGVSRGPLRTTQQASASAFYLERLAGGHGASSANGSPNGAGPASRDFGSGPAGGSPAAGDAGPGPTPAGSGGGASAAGGGAAAGPAAVALAGTDAARRVRNRVAQSAERASDVGTDVPRPPEPGPGGGSR